MKTAMPVIALIVAVLLVLSQSLYTVDQKQFAINSRLRAAREKHSNPTLFNPFA